MMRVCKRQQAAGGAESRVATGVLSYLNELLISRAVPLGDLSIVQVLSLLALLVYWYTSTCVTGTNVSEPERRAARLGRRRADRACRC
jgi:hypothetical protein